MCFFSDCDCDSSCRNKWVVQDSTEVFTQYDCDNLTRSYIAHCKQKQITRKSQCEWGLQQKQIAQCERDLNKNKSQSQIAQCEWGLSKNKSQSQITQCEWDLSKNKSQSQIAQCERGLTAPTNETILSLVVSSPYNLYQSQVIYIPIVKTITTACNKLRVFKIKYFTKFGRILRM